MTARPNLARWIAKLNPSCEKITEPPARTSARGGNRPKSQKCQEANPLTLTDHLVGASSPESVVAGLYKTGRRGLSLRSCKQDVWEGTMKLLSTSVLVAIVAWTVALSAPSQAQQGEDKLVGAWRLVSFKATAGDQVSYTLGEHPGGYVGFSPTRFWVSTRKAPAAAALTDAEAVSLMKSHAAYTGKYDVDPAQTPDGTKITIHVDAASNQALTGTNRVLYTRVDGNKLTLTSPAIVVPTSGLKSVVHLEFVRGD